MKKAACFRGMFLHPPQWWRDFCTVCKSLTRVASVGYTTNESSRLRCCQECTLSFKGPGGVDHRKKRPSKVDAQYTGCPSSFLLRSFEWCRHACAKQWDNHQNPSALLMNTGCPEWIGHEGSMFSSGTKSVSLFSSPASPSTNKPRGVAVAATAILPANGPPQVWSDTRCKVGTV